MASQADLGLLCLPHNGIRAPFPASYNSGFHNEIGSPLLASTSASNREQQESAREVENIVFTRTI